MQIVLDTTNVLTLLVANGRRHMSSMKD